MDQQQFDTLTKGSGAIYLPYSKTGDHYELAAISIATGSINNRIRVIILDANGQPAFNVWVHHAFGTDCERFPFTGEAVQFNLGVGSHYSEPNDPPNHISIENDGATDEVHVGNADIIGFQHTEWQMTFKMTGIEPTPTPTTLEQAVIAKAKTLTWMPINTDAALYKYAQAQKLGYPQCDEFKFVLGADTYIGQVFNLGICYVKKNDWGNCKRVKKP